MTRRQREDEIRDAEAEYREAANAVIRTFNDDWGYIREEIEAGTFPTGDLSLKEQDVVDAYRAACRRLRGLGL